MPQSIAHRVFKIFAWILGVIVFLALATLTRVDRMDYQEMDYYHDTMAHLDTLTIQSSEGTTWTAGWSSVNATPDRPAKLVGYRPRGKYLYVQDSSFVKTLIIGNGKSNVAFLNYELMIIHPTFITASKKRLQKRIYPLITCISQLPIPIVEWGVYSRLVGKLALGAKMKTSSNY